MPPVVPTNPVTAPPAVAIMAEPVQPVLDMKKLKSLGQKLQADFKTYENDRRNAELKWAQNLRQYLGVYDPDIEKQFDKDRSRAYPKLTRVKCVSMLSRLMNLLFPSGEKNWGVDASPVPNLEHEDLQNILNNVQQQASQDNPITDEMIEQAIREFAKMRAKNLETEIEDQLTEIGGTRLVNYVALCRKVMMSGIIYGMGVLKGPFARTRVQRRWQQTEQGLQAVDEEILVPQFEFCPIWDYYPDMSAKYMHQMDGQFQRIVMSQAQVRELADNPDFFKDQVLEYLKNHPTGNYKQKPYESEIRVLGPHTNVPVNDGRKYEVLVWDGSVSGHYLRAAGVDIPDDKLGDSIDAVVWQIDDTVVRAAMNPWAILDEQEHVNSYHHFVFEEDDSTLVGNGLPRIMRDSQMAVAAASRMILDNASVVCGPQLEVNIARLMPGQDTRNVSAYKIWMRDEDGAQADQPAVRNISIDSHLDELLKVESLFREFADVETFISPATGGDMQKGPSEPFRTAAGASMIRGEAALPFKDVVRNFDVFTESVMSSLIVFNKHFNNKASIKGDFQAVPRGSTSLIAKEVRGMGYDALVASLTDGEKLYIDWQKLLKERLTVRDMDQTIMVDDAEAKRREDAQAQSQAKKDQQMDELMRAEVRKLLADAVKAITQSDKNAAAADTVIYNSILSGLEKNVSPVEVAESRAGAGVPKGVVQRQVNPSGNGAKKPAH
jgi:hypothetical protein